MRGLDGVAVEPWVDAGGRWRELAWTAGSVTPPHVHHRRRGLSGPATVARQRTGPARADGRRSERLWRGGWHTATGQTDFLSASHTVDDRIAAR